MEDKAGNYQEAFDLYKKALDYFSTHLKYEKNPRAKEAITAKAGPAPLQLLSQLWGCKALLSSSCSRGCQCTADLLSCNMQCPCLVLQNARVRALLEVAHGMHGTQAQRTSFQHGGAEQHGCLMRSSRSTWRGRNS